VALRLPPSLAFIANLLAAWRIGAQVALLDYRLTPYEVDRAFQSIAPQVVVAAEGPPAGGLRAFHEVTDVMTTHPGRPAATADDPPPLPQFARMTTGGELVRAAVVERFTKRYDAVLANMYGMTEVGVIATDLFGKHRPAVLPAPGIPVREEAGELLVGMAASP